MRPSATFCPATMITPVLLARRWAVTGSAAGRGGGPAGRAPRRVRAWSQVSGLGLVRSSTRVAGSKNIRVFSSMRMDTSIPPRISAAVWYRPPRLTWPSLDTTRSTSIAAPGSDSGSGGGPAGLPPLAASRARSAVDRCERTDLTPGSGDGQVDDVHAGPEADHHPGPG